MAAEGPSAEDEEPMLKRISLLRDRVENWDTYPFSIPVLRSLQDFTLRERVCFFVGENGSVSGAKAARVISSTNPQPPITR